LLLTSCVAKKKYVEAQNRISQLEQQNADCTAKTTSLNTNIATLQQTNSDLQHRYDSSINSYTTQQTRWSDYTSFYDKQSSSAEQMHQTLHQQLDDMIGASNIVLKANKVYITLPESTLFSSGSTSLSTKGKQIVTTLASTISQNPDVEVYVATSATDVTNTAMNSNNGNSSMNNSNSVSNNNSTYNNGNTSNATTYNSNNSNANTSAAGNGTTSDYNTPSKKKSYSSSSKTSHSYASTTHHAPKSSSKYKSESSHRTMRSNYASSSTKPSSNSMAVARASTIVSTLRQGGVQKAGIQVTDPLNRTSTTPRKYQVIVSPSMQGYYEMMGKETGMK